MATSFQFATDADIAAVLKLRLAVDADQARRFGDDRWWTTMTEKSVARALKSSRVLVARASAVARSWPVDAIRLDAYDGPSGGGPFYKECGFTEVGRAVYRGVPLVYFEFVFPGRSSEPDPNDRRGTSCGKMAG
jgi:hypothetical protein